MASKILCGISVLIGSVLARLPSGWGPANPVPKSIAFRGVVPWYGAITQSAFPGEEGNKMRLGVEIELDRCEIGSRWAEMELVRPDLGAASRSDRIGTKLIRLWWGLGRVGWGAGVCGLDWPRGA